MKRDISGHLSSGPIPEAYGNLLIFELVILLSSTEDETRKSTSFIYQHDTQIHTHTEIQTNAHTYVHTHIHTDTHTDTHKCTHIYIHTDTQRERVTQTCARTHTQRHTRTHIHSHTHTDKQKFISPSLASSGSRGVGLVRLQLSK